MNAASPVMRFQPDREFTWSKGWDFAIRTEKRSNNHGFLKTAWIILSPVRCLR